jgi:putative membrane protein
MVVAGLVLAGLAALLHVYIFWMESLAWTSPRVRATFGTTPESAEATREMAFNQGFYNLFLAVLVVVGLVAHVTGAPTVGATLVLAGAGSMAAAALVLLVTSPDKRRPAIIQGTLPVLGIITVVIGLVA